MNKTKKSKLKVLFSDFLIALRRPDSVQRKQALHFKADTLLRPTTEDTLFLSGFVFMKFLYICSFWNPTLVFIS